MMHGKQHGGFGAPSRLHIGLATFGILALELALIRWTSSQIRIFAYFNNLVLICAFLGIGLGVALGQRRPALVYWTLPILFLLSVALALSEPLGLATMPFPDQSVHLWGAEQFDGSALGFIFVLVIFLALVGLIVAVFLCAGSVVGHLFTRITALPAYSADLAGSLAGIVAFTIATFFNAPPSIWFLIAGLPFIWLSPRVWTVLSLAGTVALAGISGAGALYSPYNRIDLERDRDGYVLRVNRDFHQYMHDLSERALSDATGERAAEKQRFRDVYDIPFRVNDSAGTALIVGAGTGNDVQAALRNGYRAVSSVDIDGRIIELGRKLHPEQPYSDPRVTPIVNDARAFFEQYTGPPFDVICFGLLDSHAMFSSMSTLRLENYVYTREAIRAAWKHVSPSGHLAISFSVYAGPWLVDRLYWTIAEGTGQEPMVLFHGVHYGATFLVARDAAGMHLDRIATCEPLEPSAGRSATRVTCDDWPFLYVRPGAFPLGYVIVLVAILAFAGLSVPWAFGRKAFAAQFDPVLFLMGAAFLLIETRSVTSLSLLFGSTWLVNSAVFGSILTVVWVANLGVERLRLTNPIWWFVLLLAAAAALWTFSPAMLNRFPLVVRGLGGGFLNALPIAFAGLIVPILLARSPNPAASLGSNLLGSVVGGCLEYLSMAVGLQALVAVAFGLYLLAFLFFLRRGDPFGMLPAAH